MERNAAPNLEKIEGLWAAPGKMGKYPEGDPLPGSWEEYYRRKVGEEEVTALVERAVEAGSFEFVGERLLPAPVSKQRPTPYLEVWHYE